MPGPIVNPVAAAAAAVRGGPVVPQAAPQAPPLAPSAPPLPPKAPPLPPSLARSAPSGPRVPITAGSLVSAKAALRPTQPHPGDSMAVAFAFRVVFGERGLKDETSFQEVSGIRAEMQVDEVPEGGENRYVQRLPKGVKYGPLVLKRGIAPANSALVAWCRATLEEGLGLQVLTAPVNVYLLDPDGKPLRAWMFADAWPMIWEVGGFDASKNEVAIETITLSYTYCNRIL